MTADEQEARDILGEYGRHLSTAYVSGGAFLVKRITAAIQSAVDEERSKGITFEAHEACCEELARQAVDADRRRLIPLVCYRCEKGQMPYRDASKYGDWWHLDINEENHDCPASPIYEAIRAEWIDAHP